MSDEIESGLDRLGGGARVVPVRDRGRGRTTRRKFLERSGGVTIAVTLSGLAAPSLIKAETSS